MREYCSSDIRDKVMTALRREREKGNMQEDRGAIQDAETAGEILESLRRDGYLDDRRYAAAFAREKAGITGWGPVKIRFALSAKRIPPEIIAEALEEIDGERAVQKLRKLMEAKWKTLAGDEAAKLKLIKYALSRGYDYDIVRTLAEEMAKPD